MKLMLRFAIVALAGAGWLVSPAAQARTLDAIISSNKLVVGINPEFPPLGEYDAKNQIAGFDVDISRKLAELLGVQLQIVKVGSPDRIPFVVSGKVDFVMGGMTRKPDRAKVIDFTVPIQTEALSVLTTAAKPFKTWKDLDSKEVKLVEVRGTTPIPFIQTNLPNAQVLLLDNYPDAVRALAQGRADAIIDVVDYLGQYMKNYKLDWKILPDPAGEIDYDSLGVAKGNDTLRRWFNVALFQLEEDGFIAGTYKKWFGISMVYPVKASPYF